MHPSPYVKFSRFLVLLSIMIGVCSTASWGDTAVPGLSPPVTQASPPGGYFSHSPQSVTLTCSDNVGCTGTFYCLGANCDPTTPYTGAVSVPVSAPLRYYSTDTAGNKEAVRQSVFTILGTPVTRVSPPPTQPLSQLTVSLSCGKTGCASIRSCLGKGCTPQRLPVCLAIGCPNGSNYPVTITTSTDLRYYAVDSQGNALEDVNTLSYVLLPSTATTTANPGGGTYSTSQSVALTCQDGSSTGCRGTFYCVGSTCTPTIPYTSPLTVSGATVLRFYSLDASGNREEVQTASYSFPGSITGRVTDRQTGNGVAGVAVSAFDAGTDSLTTTSVTDSTGQYRISGLLPQRYKIRFTATDYVLQWYSGKSDISAADSIAVSATEPASGIDVVMQKTGSLSGTVTDRDTGVGIGNVHVKIWNETGSYTDVAVTDSAGAYNAAGVTPGNYKVEFVGISGSYVSRWFGNAVNSSSATMVTVASGATTSGVSATLIKGGSISGTVTDATGVAIPGVNVSAYDLSTGSYAFATTDQSGHYTVPGVDGSYQLQFIANGYVMQWYGGAGQSTATRVGVTAPQSVSGINITLVKGGGITGVVTDSVSGLPIADANVVLFNAATGEVAGVASTDSLGAYSITSVGTGTYKVSFSAATYQDQWSGGKPDQDSALPVAVTAPNTTTAVNARLVKGGTIEGTVTDRATGAAIAPLYLMAFDADTRTWIKGSSTDSLGHYRIDGLPTGNYKISALPYSDEYVALWYGGRDEATAATIKLTAPGTVAGIDLALEKGATITGTVTAPDGTPLRGAMVSAYSAATKVTTTAVTEASGFYRIPALVSGDYLVMFSAPGRTTIWYGGATNMDGATKVTVTAPAVTSGINGTLTLGGSITGTVTDGATGKGVSDVFISAYDDSNGSWVGTAGTGSDGSYSIAGLLSGRYRLHIDTSPAAASLPKWYGSDGSALCNQPVSVTAPDVTAGINVVLEPTGGISGTVVDAATGRGVWNAHISCTVSGQTSPVKAVDSINGTYLIQGLAPGNYIVRFSAPGYLFDAPAVPVTVSASVVTSGVNGVLNQGGSIIGEVTDSSTGNGAENVVVYATEIGTGLTRSGISGAGGSYVIDGLPTGSYSLSYRDRSVPPGAGTIPAVIATATAPAAASPAASSPLAVATASSVPGTISGPPLLAQPVTLDQPVVVAAPQTTTGVEFTIQRSGGVTGKVVDKADGSPVASVTVSAYKLPSMAYGGSTTSLANGYYVLTALPTGLYQIRFGGMVSPGRGYAPTWYDGETGTGVAREVLVQGAELTTSIDGEVVKGGGIAGYVLMNSCPTPHSVTVSVYDAATDKYVSGTGLLADYSDSFSIASLPAGSYKVAFKPDTEGFLRQWYPGASDAAGAGVITVKSGETTTGISVNMTSGGGSISGTVSDAAGCAPSGGKVKVYDAFSGALVTEESVTPGTSYRITGLPVGTYKIAFGSNSGESWYVSGDLSGQPAQVAVSNGASMDRINLAAACPADSTPLGLIDAIKALRIVVGTDAVTADALARYDVARLEDGAPAPDGKIDIADALLILTRIAAAPLTAAAQ